MAQTQLIQNKGIFKALPVFPDSLKGLTAIVAGANGISGANLIRVLAEAPERWTKIYSLSRRPPAGELPTNVEHVAADFMNSTPEKLAEDLKAKGIKADYVFFYAYIQPEPKPGENIWQNAAELTRVNTLILENFTRALPLAGIKPKRFMLQTGGKYYGIHLGPAQTPMIESQPRVTLEENFYYSQEDAIFPLLKEMGCEYNSIRPCGIIGSAADAAMDTALALATYASVQWKLKKPLVFPSDFTAWEAYSVQSSAMLNAYLAEWSVLDPHTGGQSFNAIDDAAFTWATFWPTLAAWYGVEWEGPLSDQSKYLEITTPFNPPPRGYGPPATVHVRHSLAEWAKTDEVKKAWAELAEEFGLVDKEIRNPGRLMGIADFTLSPPYNVFMSTSKRRDYGFHGFVDSTANYLQAFQDHAARKTIPPVPFPNASASVTPNVGKGTKGNWRYDQQWVGK